MTNIIISIVLSLLTLLVVSISYKNIKMANTEEQNTLLKKQELELKNVEISLKYPINVDISKLLEEIISDCFNEYILFNVEFKDVTYINEALEKEILTDVSQMVIDRLSPIVINRLEILYNKANLSDIITQKVYMFILNYELEKNKQKQNVKDI